MPKRACPAEIQYMGMSGATAPCIEALRALLQCHRNDFSSVTILSHNGRHALLLKDREEKPYTLIMPGFASGYGGEGPRGLSLALSLLELHEVSVDEVDVEEGIYRRTHDALLTNADTIKINALRPVRPPRIWDYIWPEHRKSLKDKTLWVDAPPLLPLSLIDPRILDLALRFGDDPDAALYRGHRRLEEILRDRIGSNNWSSRLLTEAFRGSPPKLTWPEISEGEQSGRANLFHGWYSAHRNPRAHGESIRGDLRSLMSEFLMLNHLYILESHASETGKAQAGEA